MPERKLKIFVDVVNQACRMGVKKGETTPDTKKGKIMSVIENILAAKNIQISATYQGVKKEDNWQHHNWKVHVSGGNGLNIDTEYSKGMGHDAASGVTADDLIPAMLTDASFAEFSFQEFCNESGYEQYDPETGRENRKARGLWNACGVAAKNIKRMKFTEEEMQAILDYIEEEGL